MLRIPAPAVILLAAAVGAAAGPVKPSLDWWSLQPLQRPAIPSLGAEYTAGIHNEIDSFIRAKLAAAGLEPAAEADRRTLCRRLYFDLTGLPPAPEEMSAFLGDTDPHAYENLVDRLLASPRFGERWARHWLDVVHFGETHGYDKDQPRPNAWPYRDYVIRAFNDDKPFGRFVEEQVAGDILYPGTVDGIVALGFIAAGPWDLIGHVEVPESKIDGMVARHLDRDDMVSNTINSFCSLTVQCAQCHDHKFDPVPAADYYSLQAVFAALDRADKSYDADPAVAVRRAELAAREKALAAKDQEANEMLRKAAGLELVNLEKQIAEREKTASQGRRPEYGWHSQIHDKQDGRLWVQVDLGKTETLDKIVIAPCWDDFNGIGAGFGFPVRFRIDASNDPEFGGTPEVIAANDLTDFPNPGTAPQSFPAGGKSARYIRVTATKFAPRQNDFIVALAELQVFGAAGTNLAAGAKVESPESIEAPVRWRRTNLTDGIYPAATGGGDELAMLRKQRNDLIVKRTDEPFRAEQAATAKALAEVREAMAKLPPQSRVYAGTVHTGSGSFSGTGASGGKPRTIRVLARGSVQKPGVEAIPGALTCLKLLPAAFAVAREAPEGERRAALAHWLASQQNPLTWRSIANRLWLYHFGRGIVDTPNDFGKMGQFPSHPELLDWLACELRDGGQSLKKLHRLIVCSAAYRQSSSGNAGARQDPENRLLWRQNIRRLEAEALRDSILSVAGKLDLKMGGPSFQDFVVQHPEHSPHYEYHLADPENPALHRRSIYRFLVRSRQNPWMATMDCADPSLMVEKRSQTITPLQALAQLNNDLMVVMAKHFAARLEKEAGPDPASRIQRAFQLAFNRPATGQEIAELRPYGQQFGLENLCRVVMNLNEFVFVD